MRLRQKVIWLSLSLFLGLVLSLGLGEIVLRLTTPASFRLQNDQIILPKNRIYRYKNTGLRGCDPVIVHHTNSLGFRGPELPADFAQDLSIIAVGGSTTECFYLSDGKTWPEQLSDLLQKEFRSLWINNAGLDGHSTFGHAILLRNAVGPLQPKVVLFLVGVNDVGRDDLVAPDRDLFSQHRYPGRILRILGTVENKSRVIAWLQNLLRAGAAWRRGLGHHSVDLTKEPSLVIPQERDIALVKLHQARYLPSYQNRLRGLIQLCRELQIQPVFITQPAIFGKGHDPVTHVDLETLQVGKDENGRQAWRILELYNQATLSIAHSEGILGIDLANELPKDSRYFYDNYHFTNAGATRTAEIVAAELRPFLVHHYPDYLLKR